MIEREKKRQRLVEKYREKRQQLKAAMADPNIDQATRMELHAQLQKLPRASSRNRCWKTGRPRGYFRDFGLCRNSLREMAHRGLLPGVVKSSW
jgi:small subunit ribosomal protein S14